MIKKTKILLLKNDLYCLIMNIEILWCYEFKISKVSRRNILKYVNKSYKFRMQNNDMGNILFSNFEILLYLFQKQKNFNLCRSSFYFISHLVVF